MAYILDRATGESLANVFGVQVQTVKLWVQVDKVMHALVLIAPSSLLHTLSPWGGRAIN